MSAPDLRQSIEGLYAAFAAPAPARIDGCPCCVGRKGVGALHTKTLRELSADDLGAYGFSVFYTVGGQADFRYFLPRLFELMTMRSNWESTPETMIAKLRLAGWLDWRARERATVEAFLSALFDSAMDDAPRYDALDGVLCGLARAGLDVTGYLHRLRAVGREGALQAFFEDRWDWKRGRPGPGSAFWDDAPAAAAEVQAFLASPEVQARLGPPRHPWERGVE